jgi:hypothetical protein
MSCCGNKRASLSQATQLRTSRGLSAPPANGLVVRIDPVVILEYIGQSTLSLTGGFTNRLYHWPGRGKTQAVDERDLGGMRLHLDQLRRVR